MSADRAERDPLLTRRELLRRGGRMAVAFGGLAACAKVWGQGRGSHIVDLITPGFGPLEPDPRGVLDLPAGLRYRVFSKAGERMDDGLFVPGLHDGMAALPGPNGRTILIRNHEVTHEPRVAGAFGPDLELLSQIDPALVYDRGFGRTPTLGGTTTLVYDTRAHRLDGHFLSLAGTCRNCAGGPTPWNTWITCEETQQQADATYERDHGYCFEVPAGVTPRLTRPEPLRAMGRFQHEAVAVDPASGVVYETEDLDDGLLYRFVPERPGELAAGGRLQALVARDAPSLDTRNWRGTGSRVPEGTAIAVRWLDLDDVESPDNDLRYRGVAGGAAIFARGEGMWFGDGVAYFACTNGGALECGQIWRYRPSPYEGTPREAEQPGTLELFVESRAPGLLNYADNLTIAPWGDLIVCEDQSGYDRLIGVTPQGRLYVLARNGLSRSELAGATFSPDGTTLFVNIQQAGLTLAITGFADERGLFDMSRLPDPGMSD